MIPLEELTYFTTVVAECGDIEAICFSIIL